MRYKTDPKAASSSKGEVLANSITHGVGVGLSIAGIVFLILRAINLGTTWHLVSYIIFGTSLILLYVASTVYHSFARQPWNPLFQRLDHTATQKMGDLSQLPRQVYYYCVYYISTSLRYLERCSSPLQFLSLFTSYKKEEVWRKNQNRLNRKIVHQKKQNQNPLLK